MAATELSVVALGLALAAGAASFLSPCVLPLLPGYLSFVSGVALGDLRERDRRVVISTLAFVAGFSTMFTLAGAGAALIGNVLLVNRRPLQIAGGLLLVGFGIAITGLIRLPFLERERRALPFRERRGLVGSFLTGVIFAVGWTPCVGPILASILTLAATGRDPLAGAVLLLVYSLGLGVPFLLAGLFFSRAMGTFGWAKRHLGAIRVASGVVLVVYGVLMVTGQFTWMSSHLARFRLLRF